MSLSLQKWQGRAFYKKDHEKKMTHMLKKKKKTHMEGKESLGVVRGWGSHPGPTRGNQFCPACIASPGGKEDKVPTAWGAAVTMETEKERWVTDVVHTRTSLLPCLQRHKAAPLSPAAALYTPGLLCGSVDVGPFFNSLHSKSARS